MIYDWPSNLIPQASGFNPRGMTVSGPPSLTGRTQTGSIDSGYWVAGVGGLVANKQERVKALRALRALLEGGAHQIRVPVFDCRHAPWPKDVAGRSMAKVGPVYFSDGSTFSDGSSFWQPAISAQTVGSAAQGTTRLVVDFARSGEVVGGEYFSIGDRLYIIKAVIDEDDTELSLAIWPRLREAVPAGTPVNFDRPVCRMKMADETAMDLMLDGGRRGFPDMAFVEVSDG